MREVRDSDGDGFAVTGFGFGGVESEEDGFESGKGRGFRGMDKGKVEAGEERDEGEDDEAEVRVRREEGVVEPVAERVGVATGEGGGDGRVGGVGGEERECGAVGVGERGERFR